MQLAHRVLCSQHPPPTQPRLPSPHLSQRIRRGDAQLTTQPPLTTAPHPSASRQIVITTAKTEERRTRVEVTVGREAGGPSTLSWLWAVREEQPAQGSLTLPCLFLTEQMASDVASNKGNLEGNALSLAGFPPSAVLPASAPMLLVCPALRKLTLSLDLGARCRQLPYSGAT